MAASTGDNPNAPRGDPAPELLDGRIWVDGCFDFFHHGTRQRRGTIPPAREYLPCFPWPSHARGTS